MKITKIEQQKKNSRRYSIYLDGEFAFGLHESVLFQSGLHTGDEVSPEDQEKHERNDALFRAREAAFNLLKYRQRSTSELRKRLLQKQFTEDIVDDILHDFVEKDLLNDEKFARTFSEDLLTRKNIGPIRLRAELIKKQVPEKIINKTVESIYTKYNVRDLAQKAAEKKMATLKNTDKETAYRRLTSYLARRGFDWEIISDVVDIDPTGNN